MCHRLNGFRTKHALTHLLIAREEHPALHGDHGVDTGGLRQRESALDEAGKEIALCVGEVVLGELL